MIKLAILKSSSMECSITSIASSALHCYYHFNTGLPVHCLSFDQKYIPSMLKIIEAGILLCLLTTVTKLLVELIRHFYSNASHCIFDNKAVTGTIPIPLYWVLIVEFVKALVS